MANGGYLPLLSLLILLLPLSLLLLLYIIIRPRPVKVPIKKQHVFITGGSSGIGLALAHRAAAEGARVSILARNPAKLEEAKEAIRLATGVVVSVFSADVRDFDAVKKAIDSADPIDVLICNQGVFVAQALEEQDLEDIKFMIDVNLMGTFHLIKAALPSMKRNREMRGPASIAIMSSQGGQVGIYGYAAYSASKFGLRGMAEALQQEVIADNIHVTLIFPPDTDTPGLVEGGLQKVGMLQGLSSASLGLGISSATTSLSSGQGAVYESAENKKKPELTAIIAASSGAMKAEAVAKKAIDGIKCGSFIVPCNFEGLMLALATAGLSPQRSCVMAFVEVAAAGVLRIAGLFFQWSWYGSIEKWHAKKK